MIVRLRRAVEQVSSGESVRKRSAAENQNLQAVRDRQHDRASKFLADDELQLFVKFLVQGRG